MSLHVELKFPKYFILKDESSTSSKIQIPD